MTFVEYPTYLVGFHGLSLVPGDCDLNFWAVSATWAYAGNNKTQTYPGSFQDAYSSWVAALRGHPSPHLKGFFP